MRVRRPGTLGSFSARLGRLAGQDHLPIDPDLDPDDPGEPSREHRRSGADARVRRYHPTVLANIAVGGFFGALARYEVGTALPAHPGAFPLATFGINTSGAFAIGLVLTLILERFPTKAFLRPLTCVGFLGAWTTVSTFSTESVLLVRDSHGMVALVYLVGTLVSGLAATVIGTVLARQIGSTL
jgi:fluoride exporter